MNTLKAFLLGMQEFRSNFTTCIADPSLRNAYDRGREFAHWATFRCWEQT